MLVLILAFSLPFFAENEDQTQNQPPAGESTEQANQETVSEEQQTDPVPVTVCRCGRQIYSGSGQGYSKYDCTKCRQNYLLCQCTCWCGAETYTESEGEGQPKLCKGCQKLCPECTCADRETLLKREKQIAEGTLSQLGLQKPASALAISVVTLFMLAALCFAVTSHLKSPAARKRLPKSEIPDKPTEQTVPEKPIPEEKQEGRASPFPVDLTNLSPLDAYGAAEEYLNRSVRKREDLLAPLGAETLTAGQYAELQALSGLLPNEHCPVNTVAEREPLPKSLTNGEALTDEGEKTAKAILTPQKVYALAKRGEPGYKVCVGEDSMLILSDEGRLTENLDKKQVFAFLRKGLCDFSEHEQKLKEPLREEFGKNAFTTLLSLYLTGKNRFGEAALAKIAAAAGNESERFAKYITKLEEKGLLEKEENAYAFTFKAKTILPEPGDDSVSFRDGENRVLFVNKTDCTLCLHEQNGRYFLLTCDKIPWSIYIR